MIISYSIIGALADHRCVPPGMTDPTRCPLAWPIGRPRTRSPATARFKVKSFAAARDFLFEELRRAHARMSTVVLSSNVPLRQDGLPYAGAAQPKDAGVAVYFDLMHAIGNAKSYALACDRWRKVEENMHALALHIEALRGQERWGVGSSEEAFAGFLALPAVATIDWRDVLGHHPTLDGYETVARDMIREAHPDHGGNADQLAKVMAARDAMRAFYKGAR